MTSLMKRSGKTGSIAEGLLFSAIISTAITFLISVLLASLLNKEKITWEQAGYWIMCMLFAASFIGAKTAVLVVKRQAIVIALMSGILFWGLLLCITALFFGGNWSSVWETAAIITAGWGTAVLLGIKKRGKQGRSYRKGYR